jgi:hypothetical protein
MSTHQHSCSIHNSSQLEIELMKARITAVVLNEPLPKQRIGAFEIFRKLGAGATGTVYEARHARGGAAVALKLLDARHASAIVRFKREFRGLTNVVHENLVRLFELFCETDEWYFTMELVRGVTFTRYLRDTVAHNHSLQGELLPSLLAQLLSGLQAIHLAGKLHCDLKPANLLVTTSGHLTVLDFGLLTALSESSVAEPGRAPGTPAYMAPELEAGGPPSVASDVYAIGVILLEALASEPTIAKRTLGLERARATQRLQRARALQTLAPCPLHQLCARLLEPNPDARVSIGEALALLQMSATPGRVSRKTRPDKAWVGRQEELSTLRAAFEQLRHGEPAVAFVSGSSGIGKTALLRRFAEELGSCATVLQASCHERESLPYKAFDGLVEALPALLERLAPEQTDALVASEVEALLRVFPLLGSVPSLKQRGAAARAAESDQELRRRAFAAFKAVLGLLAEEKPLVLMVDDLQWADLDSAHLLLELVGPPAAPRVLYIGCYREDEPETSEFLRQLKLHHDEPEIGCALQRIALAPLGQAASVALAGRLLQLDSETSELCERIAREAAGIPLFVTELAAYFSAPFTPDGGSLSLSDLIARRLAQLHAVEQRALHFMALAARPLSEQVLGQALGEDSGIQYALQVLSVEALVHTDAQGRLVIYHDRLREHLTAGISPADAMMLHGELARAYESLRTGEPEWLIAHWRAAGEASRAFACAVAAAELAGRKLAFNHGAALYRAAIDLASAIRAPVTQLYAALGDMLVNAGRGREAAAAYVEAARGASTEDTFQMRCHASQNFLRSGALGQGNALLKELLRECGTRYPKSNASIVLRWLLSRARLALRARLGRNASGDQRSRRRLRVLGAVFREYAVVDPLRGMLFQSQFYEEALRTGEHESIFFGMAWDIYNRAFLRNVRRWRSLAPRLAELDRLAAGLGTPYALATAILIRAMVGLCDGDYLVAARESARAMEIFRERCLGTVWEETFCSLVRAAAIDNTGPLTALCDESPVLVRRANERSDHLADRLLGTPMGTAFLAQDEPMEAVAFLRRRLAGLPPAMDVSRLGIVLKLTDAMIYANDGPDALQTIEEAWPAYLHSGLDRTFMRMFVRLRRAGAALTVFRARGGDALHRLARAEASVIEGMQRRDATIIAHGIRAAIAYQSGRPSEARRRLQEALTLAEPMGVTVTTHCYLLQLGVITPGPQGAAIRAKASAVLRSQGVANPRLFANTYVSGL